MVSLHKGYGDDSIAVKSFEETYKTAYSHGLEAIYTLETVDIKSVRRIQDPSINTTADTLFLNPTPRQPESPQLEFDFQSESYKCLASFLSGHLFDYAAWIRSLASNALIKKKLYVSLESYQLTGCIALSPMETVELKRMTLEKRKEWQGAIGQAVNSADAAKMMHAICEVFIRSWMCRRLGLASKLEIMERQERISAAPLIAQKAVCFFSEALHCSVFSLLEEVEKNVFCADASVKKAYDAIVQRSLTYFYKPGVKYGLHELIAFMTREFARNWVGFPEGFIEKVLRISERFHISKALGGRVEIKVVCQ